ncbi:MAG: YifB family Mg chelatase-like AAA ATPase [Deltaproteobacteria bacterium]
MVIKTFSSAVEGIEGAKVQIEAVAFNALPQILMTGLPGEVVKESRERVRACLMNLGFDLPNRKILVHLSPASVKKHGSHYDLAITLAVLACESKLKQIPLEPFGFLGELSLEGRLSPVKGALPLIEVLVQDPKIRKVIIPRGNEPEGALLNSGKIVLADTLEEVIQFIQGQRELALCSQKISDEPQEINPVFDQVIGQSLAKRALQIALAGRHPLLLVGQPGVGKSMLSLSARELLPKMSDDEFIEVLKIYSASSVEAEGLIQTKRRPFRAPHHSISANALLGGGMGTVMPGEISLAHHGLLFLDEFPEYRRDAIEGLREPMQNGVLNLTRVGKAMSFPARFTLIAAMNPCPCGMYSIYENQCRCTPEKKAQYRKKLSSPILDRMALMVYMTSSLDNESGKDFLCFKSAKDTVEIAFKIQNKRYQNFKATITNGCIENLQSVEGFQLKNHSEDWLKQKKLENRLSFRRLHQIIKVARTIADLEESNQIEHPHVLEAWNLRCFDFYQIH